MHSSAAHSASITPAASCTSARTAGCASGSAPSRAATAVEACDVETSRTPLAGPNAPSTSPWRSVFVQHGRPAEYRWRRALRENFSWVKVNYRYRERTSRGTTPGRAHPDPCRAAPERPTNGARVSRMRRDFSINSFQLKIKKKLQKQKNTKPSCSL